jgi:DNA-binding NarL/FixJ family response regulator
MTRKEELSRLIGEIYDAALDPSLWSNLLARIAHFAGGSAACLFVEDFVNPSRSFQLKAGVSSKLAPPCAETRGNHDARQDAASAAIIQNLAAAHLAEPHVSHFRWEQTPQQQPDADVECTLDKSSERHACLRISRHGADSLGGKAILRRVHPLIPHLRRALSVANAVSAHATEVETFTKMLDTLTAGVFFIVTGQRVIRANTSAQRMLDQRGLLRLAQGRLVLNELGGAKTFPAAVTAMLADSSSGGSTIPLQQHEGDHYVAHILPLALRVRHLVGEIYAAAAAVIVQKASLEVSPASREVISKVFNLTQSEVKVFFGIVEVGGVPQIAELLGTSQATVNKHLQHIFAKTGTCRQAELVKLAASFSNLPIR